MNISLNQLNRKTGHRIKYAKVDSDTFDEAEDLPDLGWLLRAVDLRAVDEAALEALGADINSSTRKSSSVARSPRWQTMPGGGN